MSDVSTQVVAFIRHAIENQRRGLSFAIDGKVIYLIGRNIRLDIQILSKPLKQGRDGIVIMGCSLLNIYHIKRITQFIWHRLNGSRHVNGSTNGYGIVVNNECIQVRVGPKAIHGDINRFLSWNDSQSGVASVLLEIGSRNAGQYAISDWDMYWDKGVSLTRRNADFRINITFQVFS